MSRLKIQKNTIQTWGPLPFEIQVSFKGIFEHWEAQAKSTSKDNEIKTGAVPFTDIFFNPTRRFKYIVKEAGADFEFKIRQVEDDLYYIYACTFILGFRYGVDLKTPRSYYIDIPNLTTQRTSHYRVMFNGDFSEIEPVDPDFSISKEDVELLRNNAHNIEVWKDVFPPNSFVFRGFGIINLFDVTIEEIISELKTELLHPDVFQSEIHLKGVKDKVTRILEMEDLEMGIFILDKNDETVECFKDVQFKSLLLKNERNTSVTECLCSFGQEELLNMNPVFFSDLTKLAPDEHPQVERLAEINTVSINKIFDIIPIFAVTMQRWMVMHETMMESIIQQNFTVIHPAVSWKFFEVAEDLWAARQQNPDASIKDIVFEEVTPLFGQSDIKGSTDERNNAVQADLRRLMNTMLNWMVVWVLSMLREKTLKKVWR